MIRFLLLAAMLAATLSADAPVWDNTGNGQLKGDYNFRQVLYVSDGSGTISQQIAYFGTITFSGTGAYTLSGSNTQVNTGSPVSIQPTGTYSVATSGFGFLSNPLLPGASVYFLVAKGVLVGSSTETTGARGAYDNDLFIAAPATPAFTNASFTGAYTWAGFLPGLAPATTADISVQLSSDGAGKLTTVNSSGYRGASPTALSQSFTDVPYSFSGGTGVITFPVSLLPLKFYSGPENIYVSPDSNFIFGGSPTGYDMFVGVRTSGTASVASGLYYEVGLDEDNSQLLTDEFGSLDTYYGVFNAFSGNILGHERLLYAGSSAEGTAYNSTYPSASYTGPANVGQLDPSATVRYVTGAGSIRIGFGIGPWLGIEVALPASPATAPGGAPFLDATGIVNTASSAPFTAGISPGEFITIYNGVGLAGASQDCWTAGPPYPKSLDGVQVLIDGIQAPIYCVGPQITVIVPFAVKDFPIASIQVINNNALSNVATTYVYKTNPGVFTVPAGGLGFAAAQRGPNLSLITPDNPARPGETIVVYLSGLGNVFPVNGQPPVDGGAAGPNGDTVISNIQVDVSGIGSTSIPYAGLTPGTAGLYQINFQVPPNAPVGSDPLAIVGPNSFSSQALLPVGNGPGADPAVPAMQDTHLPRLRGTIPR